MLSEPPKRYTKGFLNDLDRRTAISSELRERHSLLTNDLGGLDNLSYQQRSLCERALFIEYHLAKKERDLVEGSDFDMSGWVKGCYALHKIYASLGLERQSREIPTLDSYIQRMEGNKNG